jgi:hypothetical protein
MPTNLCQRFIEQPASRTYDVLYGRWVNQFEVCILEQDEQGARVCGALRCSDRVFIWHRSFPFVFSVFRQLAAEKLNAGISRFLQPPRFLCAQYNKIG